MGYSLVWTLILILFGHEASAVAFDVRVVVPKNLASGSTATLNCQFTCDAKTIYSVKWYRGSREFFRVMPGAQPSIKTFDFPVGKLYINMAASNISQVTLRNVSPKLSGLFTCEVTVLPNLATVSARETLYIYDPVYLSRPTIRTEEYALDARTPPSVNVRCGFDEERAIAVPVEKIPFVFYVNQKKIDPTFTVYDDYSGFLILNTSLLRWKDRSERRRISCSANLPGTSGLRSDELLLNASKRLTADAIHSCTVVGIMFVLAKWCS